MSDASKKTIKRTPFIIRKAICAIKKKLMMATTLIAIFQSTIQVYPITLEEENPPESIPMQSINKYIYLIATNPNIRAFLSLIAYYETHGKGYPLNKIIKPNLEHYKILWGKGSFDSLLQHPKIKVALQHSAHKRCVVSSAAGRYQFIHPTWLWIEQVLKIQSHEDLQDFLEKYSHNIGIFKQNIPILYDHSIVSLYNVNVEDAEYGKEKYHIHKELFGPFFQDLGAMLLLDIAGKKANINILENIAKGNFGNIAIYEKIAPIWEIFSTMSKRSELPSIINTAKNLQELTKKAMKGESITKEPAKRLSYKHHTHKHHRGVKT